MDQAIKQISQLLGINPLAKMEFYDDSPRPVGYFPFGAPYQKRETVTKYEDGTYSCSCDKQVHGNGLTNCTHMIQALCVSEVGKFWKIIKENT